jgi:hypothetical protein
MGDSDEVMNQFVTIRRSYPMIIHVTQWKHADVPIKGKIQHRIHSNLPMSTVVNMTGVAGYRSKNTFVTTCYTMMSLLFAGPTFVCLKTPDPRLRGRAPAQPLAMTMAMAMAMDGQVA